MHNTIAAHKQVGQTLRCLVKIAEKASEGIAVITLNGTIRFVNTAWATMHGYNTMYELVGKQISIFHTEQQFKTDVTPFIEETKRRGRLAGPVKHVRKDGTLLPTQMKMTTVTNDSGKPIGLIVFATDITERKQIEAELKQRCNQLEQQVDELTAQLAAANEQLRHEVAERKLSEEALLENIIDAKGPTGPIEPPFNPQELKALSELAKRLA